MKGFIGARQTTLASEISLTGTGVHGGAPVSISLCPADGDTGLRFHISNGEADGIEIAADQQWVTGVTLCTVLGDGNGASVATVEHLLAALRGLGVDNALIEIDSPEVPIMDGSAAPFVEAIDEVGLTELDAPRRFLKVLKPICVEDGGAVGELTPHNGFRLDVEIGFETQLIGTQKIEIDVNPGSFRRELARARTFGFMKDVERLWAAGLALGASLENTVAIGDDRIINREGLRFADEFVRHKALDAVGDLALAGAPILGAYRSRRGGHRLNALVLKALFADPDAWTMVEAPRYREVRHAELSHRLAAANFAADRS
ncbi:UDP-3-O-[3-hydroxymyristoyl] N-acetylglucosamine deacetylase [Methyloceanibacter superfactus]|uniref:UDP-3-O-acyl-N-acetylglucosamine deacetylase n=1 Tax=Methyloceanibacter superfactus TaxID=1774969 RepID=A0A1E3VWU5_9HYPH|nr:UDP-3-O-acyl-N-acetylglucosamine deacetylase [Methyloceanibacter superfactus]ODR97731.1 UDP-3-O-[3-hydroxymyristoyl] N-acetylglucosamine deacetylase [Methyloceanibacter superfactus]